MNDDTPDPGFARRSEPPASGTCARCGQHTNNGIAHWTTCISGPDACVVVHADSAECLAA